MRTYSFEFPADDQLFDKDGKPLQQYSVREIKMLTARAQAQDFMKMYEQGNEGCIAIAFHLSLRFGMTKEQTLNAIANMAKESFPFEMAGTSTS